MNIIGCKWVYRTKRKADGSVERYKARLIAKGFNQVASEDFFDTFSPVVKPTTVRMLFSLAVSNSWTLRQLDVHNAFLNGNIAETVYMKQPPGYEDPLHPDHTDLSLFYYSSKSSRVFLLVYVDDIIMLGNDASLIDDLLLRLSSVFKIRDLGTPSFFLGIETLTDGKGFILSQKRYMTDILHRAGMSDCKPLATPAAVTAPATPSLEPYENPTQYRRIVGALQYLTITHPDLSYAVNRLCQFMHSLTEAHWALLKRVLRYVKGSQEFGLRIVASSSTDIQAYSNSDWAGCPIDRKSTSGYAVYLGDNLVSWGSRKQRTVARSSTEAEYKGLADVYAEVTWIVSLLVELGFHSGKPATLWCDNLGATYLAANPVFHARTKHVEIDYHFVRDKVATGDLIVNFVSTRDQIADIFTKPLPAHRFQFLRDKLNVAAIQPCA
ncbi:uncharacterized protein LOC116020577 [Ipomoea triloba]|uniref:uncharacterized protein LOC116020577 n=1 Tax=Ipomoea triloba TaxID=35885 RepID=UPI00125DF7D8|nr:uncharacterized protein LOC116020577 [Ipomoea triloba]